MTTQPVDYSAILETVSPLLSILAHNHSVTSLYERSIPACLILFRFLPKHAKAIFVRLLFIKGVIPFGELRTWIKVDALTDLNQALWLLKKIGVLQGRGGEVWICEAVQRQFQRALTEDLSQRWERTGAVHTDTFLEQHVENFIKEVLTLLVTPEKSHADDFLLELVLEAGLMDRMQEGHLRGELSITSEGFKFLLLDRHHQMWMLLRRKQAWFERFLDLGYLPHGYSYRIQDQVTANFYHQLGLVYVDQELGCYTPTSLAFALVSEHSESSASYNCTIILETNYKIYALTEDELLIDILGLYADIKGRQPGLVYGCLTQDSVTRAYDRGIGWHQIVHHLTTHAHPQMRKQYTDTLYGCLPYTVIEQLRIWEQERRRVVVVCEEAYLYTDFTGPTQQQEFREACRVAGADLLYIDEQNKRLVARELVHERIKSSLGNVRSTAPK